jgi:hypothetical protein
VLAPLAAPPAAAETALRSALMSSANAGGGWGYYAGKASRIEPTAWALAALGAPGAEHPFDLAPHAAFLQRAQQSSGWLADVAGSPVNVGFNALAAILWFARPGLASDAARRALLAALVSTKGIQVKAVDPGGQDNSLQGWPWIDATFSWVEPTAWGLLALKHARRAGATSAEANARIEEAERLLINRTCRTGGWNFGNAVMMAQDLRAYVPTTALGLVALQDRAGEDAVRRSLDFLEAHWRDEISASSLGLSLLALDAFGRRTSEVDAALRAHVDTALSFGNLHGDAIALAALAGRGPHNVLHL